MKIRAPAVLRGVRTVRDLHAPVLEGGERGVEIFDDEPGLEESVLIASSRTGAYLFL